MQTLGRLVCEGIFVASVVFTVWVNRPTSFVVIAGTLLAVLGIFGAVSLMGRAVSLTGRVVGALGKPKDRAVHDKHLRIEGERGSRAGGGGCSWV